MSAVSQRVDDATSRPGDPESESRSGDDTPRLRCDVVQAAHVAEILKALAHPLRIRIVAILVESPRTVTELTAELGVPQPIVSQQLRILRMRNVARPVREHGHARYHLAEPRLAQLIACMEGCSIK